MGSCTIATRPTITMRMEITMATMGRLMKNLAMVGLFRGAGCCGRAGLDPDLLAGARSIDALDDDPLAGLQPLRDDPERAHARVDLDGADVDRVAGPDHRDLMDSLQILDGALGHEERVLLHLDDGPDLGVLARAQHVARIRKDAARHHGAGRHVDLTIEDVGSSTRGIGAAVSEDELQLDVPWRA